MEAMITPTIANDMPSTDVEILDRARALSPFFSRMLESDPTRETALLEGLQRP